LNSPLLYIHIPFCDSKCFYCSFNSYTHLHSEREIYVDSLLKQLDYEIDRFEIDSFKTVFIGGGTPSTLSPKLVEKIFTHLENRIKRAEEITVEANPNSASKEWLETIKSFGADRVSLGVQSFDSEKLKFLGRNHSREMAISSIQNAKDIGFKRINLDLIYGTALDSRQLLEEDVETALSLPIDHISLYSLTIEEGTLFTKTPEKSRENLDDTRWLFSQISEKFPQYEISNFGNPSLHNLGYWQGENYLGVGSGAVGFWRDRRFYPERDVKRYIENPLQISEEILSEQDLKNEKIFLGLRSKVGVLESTLSERERKNIDFLTGEGLLKREGDRYFNLDYLLSDEIYLRVVE
jgi:oxygen-independent coproporphyrinogen-3 oxidase